MPWGRSAALCLCVFAGGLVRAAPVRLSLEQAVARARRQHPLLGLARAQLSAARARRLAAVSQWTPSLTGSFAYNPQTANFVLTPGFQRFLTIEASTSAQVRDVRGTVVDVSCVAPSTCPNTVPPRPRPTSYQLFDFWNASVGLSWSFFEWGKSWHGYRAAEAEVGAQGQVLAWTAADVVLNVKTAYLRALASEAAVLVGEEAVQTQERHLAEARAFLQAGTRTRIDVSSAESDLATAELRLAVARGERDAAQAQLGVALGDEGWVEYALQWPAEEPEAPLEPAAALAERAVGDRAEVRELKLRARGLDETARALRAASLPALSLSGGPSFAGTELSSLTTNASIMLSLSYPSLGMNPLQVAARVREARAGQAALHQQVRAMRHAVRLDVALARAQLGSAREALRAARRRVVAARERRDLAQGRYQAGVGTILELSDAELAFEDARFQEVDARYRLAQAGAQLEWAMGRG